MTKGRVVLGFRFHVGPISWGPSRSKESSDDGAAFGFLFALVCITSAFYPVFGALALGVYLFRLDAGQRSKLLPFALTCYFALFAIWAAAFWYVGYSAGSDGRENVEEYAAGLTESGFLMVLPGGFLFAFILVLLALAGAGVYFVVRGVKKAWQAI